MSIEAITGVIAIVLSFLGGCAAIIFRMGRISERIDSSDRKIEAIEHDMKDLSQTVTEIKVSVGHIRGSLNVLPMGATSANSLSRSNSPRQLNDLGKKVLNDSGIDKILENYYEEIVDSVKSSKPENSYQAQEAVYRAVSEIMENSDTKNAVEEGAFLSGYTPQDVLFVGALNIRDRVLEELGFAVGDIDKHSPENPTK